MDIFFRRDIANVLKATACASEGAAEMAAHLLGAEDQEQLLRAYRMGVHNALVSVGLGVGLVLTEAPGKRREVQPPLAGLLWVETKE